VIQNVEYSIEMPWNPSLPKIPVIWPIAVKKAT